MTLDDGATVEFDDCLIATGSRAVKPPVPGADGPGVHCFWTLDEARAVIAGVRPGTRVVMVGAGFIAFTILNAILARGASLTIVEVAPRILPRMVDDACAAIVAEWLSRHGVAVRTSATLTVHRGVAREAPPRVRVGGADGRRPRDHGHRHPARTSNGSRARASRRARSPAAALSSIIACARTGRTCTPRATWRGAPTSPRAPARSTPSSRPPRSTAASSAPTWRAAR